MWSTFIFLCYDQGYGTKTGQFGLAQRLFRCAGQAPRGKCLLSLGAFKGLLAKVSDHLKICSMNFSTDTSR
jgi:hypothetical protein